MRIAIVLITLVAFGSCARPQASNDTVFVSNEGSNQVSIVDGATGRIEGQLATGPRPRGIELDRAGQGFETSSPG